jgi:uncharacterized protein
MNLSWDEQKRLATLALRGLDFAQTRELFEHPDISTQEDQRFDYGEIRFISMGWIAKRLCVVVWTPRDNSRHIISLRKANDREKARFESI